MALEVRLVDGNTDTYSGTDVEDPGNWGSFVRYEYEVRADEALAVWQVEKRGYLHYDNRYSDVKEVSKREVAFYRAFQWINVRNT